MTDLVRSIPWDSATFGQPAWEVAEYSPAALAEADNRPGHQTIKVDPLADKALLQRHGFYYTDTLIETRAEIAALPAPQVPAGLAVSRDIDRDGALAICHGAFQHGRFHRDPALPRALADARYDNWLDQMLAAGTVFGLYAEGTLGGFIAYQGHSFVLHAVDARCRGQGRARPWWWLAIQQMAQAGHTVITSSISAANMPVLNLYSRLGFSFQHPQDIYHRVVPA